MTDSDETTENVEPVVEVHAQPATASGGLPSEDED